MEKAQTLTTQPLDQPGERSFTRRWNHVELFDAGFVVVPSTFLRLYAHLKPHRLTLGEAMFVLHLMEFKWGADDPFPGYATLAERMGVSIKMVRRHAQSLQAKKYLRREVRTGRTNRFDLSPLFDALLKAFQEERQHLTQSRTARSDFGQQMISWANRMMEAYRSMSPQDRQVLADWEAENLDGGSVATSDWPGWAKLVGRKPQP